MRGTYGTTKASELLSNMVVQISDQVFVRLHLNHLILHLNFLLILLAYRCSLYDFFFHPFKFPSQSLPQPPENCTTFREREASGLNECVLYSKRIKVPKKKNEYNSGEKIFPKISFGNTMVISGDLS